jgi:hypothetical protein
LTFAGDAIDCAAEKPARKNPTTSKINFSVPISSTGTSEPGYLSTLFHQPLFYCDKLTFAFFSSISIALSN